MDARSLSKCTPRHGRISLSLLIAGVVAGVVWLPSPAKAQTSDLHGTVSVSYAPGGQQSFVDAKVAELTDLHAVDTFGNDAKAGGSLSTPGGNFLLTTHACSGGGPGFGGQANATTNADATMDYEIISSTLPLGTPVQVSVNWAVLSKVTAVGQDMTGVGTGCSANAHGQVVTYVNWTPILNKSGDYSRSHNVYDGILISTSGALNVQNDSCSCVYAMQVGQIVRVTMVGSLRAASVVAGDATTDGDAQMVMVWGVSSLNPDASAVLASDITEPAPPAANGTPANAAALLPPRPIDLLPCFRIPTQPVSDSSCTSGNASFTVAALGTGPFTYQWRKNGVPINSETNSSAVTATLSLMGLSSGDAGSYDCVISNPCGDVTSNAASLTVCAASIGGGQPPQATRLAVAGPAPFRASTTLAFTLASAGEARLEVFDLQGARVRTLASGWHNAGTSEVVWRGEDNAGRRVPSGVYFVRLQANGFIGTQRIVALP